MSTSTLTPPCNDLLSPRRLTMSVTSSNSRRTPGVSGSTVGHVGHHRSKQYHRNHHRVTDYHTEQDTDHRATSPRIGQRSQSLSALQPNATVIQPRMAQLETLEAKMASIEVSLSSGTPRRKKCLPLTSPSPSRFLGSSTTPLEQLEGLRNALRDKENIIRSLRGQVTTNNNIISSTTSNGVRGLNAPGGKEVLNESERRHLEERLQRLKQDTENKRLTIKNLKLALDKLDITDNIDIRIQQAELEYHLGREELNLLTLLEESRTVQARLEDSATPVAGSGGRNRGGSVHATVTDMGGTARLVAMDISWCQDAPKFGIVAKTDAVFVEWAAGETGLKKGDRVVEINGKLLITRTPSSADLTRLLSACPDSAQLVVLRTGGVTCSEDVLQVQAPGIEVSALRSELGLVREQAEEAQRAKDGLRADNLRLTHRISYLEEQVSELLESRRHRHHNHNHHNHHHQQQEQQIRVVTTTAVNANQNVTNINIGAGDVQVFQKGPQMTALVAGTTRASAPSRAPSSPCIAASDKYTTDEEQKSVVEPSSRRRSDSRSVKSLELDSEPYSTHSTTNGGYARPRKSLDYTSEPVSSSAMRKRPTPPKKPVRLSLHRAQSLQNVEPEVGKCNSAVSSTGNSALSSHHVSETNVGRKRTHRGERSAVSGLRWPVAVHLHQRHTARWC